MEGRGGRGGDVSRADAASGAREAASLEALLYISRLKWERRGGVVRRRRTASDVRLERDLRCGRASCELLLLLELFAAGLDGDGHADLGLLLEGSVSAAM